MKLVRIISYLAFYIFRILGLAYLFTTLYLLISVLLKLPSFVVSEDNKFTLLYPFTNIRFLLGSEFTLAYVSEMLLVMGFYGLFFFFLSSVFGVFKQKKLFTMKGVKTLKYFYFLNLFVSPVLFLFFAGISTEDLPYMAMIVAHVIIGIFAFFLAAIFLQGLNLQDDQDLII